jgi:hypothetical protein
VTGLSSKFGAIAERYGSAGRRRVGLNLQREASRAGWHRPAAAQNGLQQAGQREWHRL